MLLHVLSHKVILTFPSPIPSQPRSRSALPVVIGNLVHLTRYRFTVLSNMQKPVLLELYHVLTGIQYSTTCNSPCHRGRDSFISFACMQLYKRYIIIIYCVQISESCKNNTRRDHIKVVKKLHLSTWKAFLLSCFT